MFIMTHIPHPTPIPPKPTIQEGGKPQKGMAGSKGMCGEEWRETRVEGEEEGGSGMGKHNKATLFKS